MPQVIMMREIQSRGPTLPSIRLLGRSAQNWPMKKMEPARPMTAAVMPEIVLQLGDRVADVDAIEIREDVEQKHVRDQPVA